jgi:riboflavin synthase
MFTGIIEETGKVVSIRKEAQAAQIDIAGGIIFDDMHLGDSVAVNGVCLTVAKFGAEIFTADIMNETLRRSSLGNLKPGSAVNLERAMAADGRFGGHIVSGHIDGTGKISAIRQEGRANWLTIKADKKILRYIIEKGSVCIDGISLTVANVDADNFQVSIIPHTMAATTLATARAGTEVNLENDIVGKYIERFVRHEANEGQLTPEFLLKSGF